MELIIGIALGAVVTWAVMAFGRIGGGIGACACGIAALAPEEEGAWRNHPSTGPVWHTRTQCEQVEL